MYERREMRQDTLSITITFFPHFCMSMKTLLTTLVGLVLTGTIAYLIYGSMQPITVGDDVMMKKDDSMMSSSEEMMENDDAMMSSDSSMEQSENSAMLEPDGMSGSVDVMVK